MMTWTLAIGGGLIVGAFLGITGVYLWLCFGATDSSLPM